MTDEDKPDRGGKVLGREEARRKRDKFLALAEEQARAERQKEDPDADEPTVATMILPGD